MEEVYVRSDFTLIGQVCYEPGIERALHGAGIRLYENVDPAHKGRQFLCVEDPDTLAEASAGSSARLHAD